MTVQTLESDSNSPVTLCDYAPAIADFQDEVCRGLSQYPKRLACKFFYDEAGSHLFDRICETPEYYQTRTELKIMRRHIGEMIELAGPGALLVEYGSGTSLKTRVLLDHLKRPAGYVPIDISRPHLARSACALAVAYPRVPVLPVCADYTASFDLPLSDQPVANVVAYFPGSTIGNFEPREAVRFLKKIRQRCGEASDLLIGVDLKKDPAMLHAAYNDASGVTAQFNLNLLRRINEELHGTFDLNAFAHHACYNPREARIEMHLVSLKDQDVSVGERSFRFEQGESVHTENSYKYTISGFARLAKSAGYRVARVWTDERSLFSVQYLQGE